MDIAAHVEILHASYLHWTGRALIEPRADAADAPTLLDQAPFAVVSHGTQDDPIFNYANRRALELFEMSWAEFTRLPSRLSAEPLNREERSRLLERVTRNGYVDDYIGVRISKSGKRFLICDATVWNLLDSSGKPYGQAALIANWKILA
ncbi:MAG: MEKHLA domain-containing protein [Sulfuricella sp.]|nr:MEKHLA domain-containing protein [Sulfuricella sp.]